MRLPRIVQGRNAPVVVMLAFCVGACAHGGRAGLAVRPAGAPAAPAPLADPGSPVVHPDTASAAASAATVSVDPLRAAPGATVQLQASGFPPNASLTIAFGAPRGEPRPIHTATSDASGTLAAAIQVPSWASSGTAYVFTVATSDGSATATSGVFEVTSGG